MQAISSDNKLTCEKILDAVNSGLILVDAEGKVLLWNDWTAQHSGIPVADALGCSLETLFGDGLTTAFKSAVRNALSFRLPIVLSHALHRTPLPLYSLPLTQQEQPRIQQSVTLTPIVNSSNFFCLLQITDASIWIKRESVLKSHSERLGKEATTDALTGTYNRRFFDDRFRAEFGRVQRQETPLSLIMLDIDYFKNYNDTYGHPAGDRALIAVAKAIDAQLNRATDIVVRYGGEEFIVILPDAGSEGGLAVAEKLRAAIAELGIPHGTSKVADHLTVSVGLSTYQPSSDIACDTGILLESVDAALYQAKLGGRNSVRHLIV